MSFETRKWVRIMADHAAHGVWDDEGLPGYPEDLAIPQDLVDRIGAWQEWFDRDSTDYLPENRLDLPAFSKEGLEIAKAVKAALPDWTVIYFDDARLREFYRRFRRKQNSPEDRAFFEYEIPTSSMPDHDS
ncbi:hypothetical protein [Rhizobium alvei]|uniref:Uncharacterized protein n=1 Tax=Rhizobium alvei TaxID=1132659 RepID=A0ABT8YPE1_9HYPH|nr:hypothetical protein [Rhizobium alvei]MDO6965228.1 hypothetical protein [Rhizobium alvei]